MTIDITRDLSLDDLEALTRQIASSSQSPRTVRLARDFGSQFFKTTRLAALLATAAADASLEVMDWIDATDDRTTERFTQTIEGITALTYATKLTTTRGDTIPIDREHAKRAIIERLGQLEERLTKHVTFCAFDPENPVPLALSLPLATKNAFINEFPKIRRRYMEVGVGQSYSERTTDLFGHHDPVGVGEFVYEILTNAQKHGALNASSQPTKGVRFLQLQRHAGNSSQDFLRRAAQFPELVAYIRSLHQETSLLFEVAISDYGMGIVRRFQQTRPEYPAATALERNQLLHQIIDQGLTSHRFQPGAGHGLERALRAVSSLRGFVSLRTDQSWLYYHGDGNPSLREVITAAPLPYVRGTHVNLLFPLDHV
jgi:hypothetical protein